MLSNSNKKLVSEYVWLYMGKRVKFQVKIKNGNIRMGNEQKGWLFQLLDS